ncbi:unnamed protein product [Lepeophtheirus salmonis]|uniref:(salmon louse) hypothetical protein n=1 Tax=Lepeophtheirus salmonis TaxID=72036 RepID=A0A7R8H634_LEPSM|nr:unnamed protein product [Lepeophtheirus salmonis]CAF2894346.1 unnamed protein product [Lepeophtheirus salmonis]
MSHHGGHKNNKYEIYKKNILNLLSKDTIAIQISCSLRLDEQRLILLESSHPYESEATQSISPPKSDNSPCWIRWTNLYKCHRRFHNREVPLSQRILLDTPSSQRIIYRQQPVPERVISLQIKRGIDNDTKG